MFVFPFRLLAPWWTPIRVQPCLRSLLWLHNKGDYGSAGCPPTEARTPASLTSPSKVCFEWLSKTDNRRYLFLQNLTVRLCCCVLSEPPVPTTAPKLLEKRSKQLLVMPMDSHRGDGPIVSTRLLYKPEKNGDSWSSIIGELERLWVITTENNLIWSGSLNFISQWWYIPG